MLWVDDGKRLRVRYSASEAERGTSVATELSNLQYVKSLSERGVSPLSPRHQSDASSWFSRFEELSKPIFTPRTTMGR
jgi:hypothetical protein